jgi:hypothetical protein
MPSISAGFPYLDLTDLPGEPPLVARRLRKEDIERRIEAGTRAGRAGDP